MERKSGAVNFKDWSIGSTDELLSFMEHFVLKECQELIQYALDSDDSYHTFPIVWASPEGSKHSSDGHGGQAVTDPLTVYFKSGLGGEDFGGPVYTLNLRDMLRGELEDCASDGSFSYGLRLLSAEMRKLADEIDAAITAGEAKA